MIAADGFEESEDKNKDNIYINKLLVLIKTNKRFTRCIIDIVCTGHNSSWITCAVMPDRLRFLPQVRSLTLGPAGIWKRTKAAIFWLIEKKKKAFVCMHTLKGRGK